jgi:hypothetical protein
MFTLEQFTPDVFTLRNKGIHYAHYDEIFSESTQ